MAQTDFHHSPSSQFAVNCTAARIKRNTRLSPRICITASRAAKQLGKSFKRVLRDKTAEANGLSPFADFPDKTKKCKLFQPMKNEGSQGRMHHLQFVEVALITCRKASDWLLYAGAARNEKLSVILRMNIHWDWRIAPKQFVWLLLCVGKILLSKLLRLYGTQCAACRLILSLRFLRFCKHEGVTVKAL